MISVSQPDGTHLAQLNLAYAVDGMDSPRMADFMRALDGINTLGKRSPGFVWILEGDGDGGATDIRVDGDPDMLVNLTVWETPEDLEQFVWNTAHKNVYAKKAKWFKEPTQAYFVMWWIPIGHTPTVEEALERITDLRENGPSERAFGWESLPNVKLWKEARCG